MATLTVPRAPVQETNQAADAARLSLSLVLDDKSENLIYELLPPSLKTGFEFNALVAEPQGTHIVVAGLYSSPDDTLTPAVSYWGRNTGISMLRSFRKMSPITIVGHTLFVHDSELFLLVDIDESKQIRRLGQVAANAADNINIHVGKIERDTVEFPELVISLGRSEHGGDIDSELFENVELTASKIALTLETSETFAFSVALPLANDLHQSL